MEYLIGIFLAVGVAALATGSGMDRSRSFYPTVAIVVPFYYVLFAVMGASTGVIGTETSVSLGFTTLAVIGFKRNLWLAAAALAGHGLFDAVHHLFIQNPGVPVWWPGFCGTVDVLLGAWAAIRLLKAPAGTAISERA